MSERPEIIIAEGQPFDWEAVFDVPPHTQLRIVIKEEGKGDSYVEYDREDGSTRRLLTKKGGGELGLTTARV